MLTGIFMKYIVKQRLNKRTGFILFSQTFFPNPSFEKLIGLQNSNRSSSLQQLTIINAASQCQLVFDLLLVHVQFPL